MATVAISGLPAATGVAGADVTPIVQSATTKKVTFSAIFAAPPAIGGTTPAAGTFTTLSATDLSVTGTGSFTGSAATLTQSLSAGGTTTGANYWTISNTGGNLRLGVDNSTGVSLITGGTAYGGVVGTNNNTTLHLISNGTSIAQITTTGLAVTGTVNINGTAASTTAGQVQFGSTTQSTIGANGAASALTANPLGYLIAYLGTTKIIIPYYNG